MNEIYLKLSAGHHLTVLEAEILMKSLCEQQYNDHQVAFILGLFKTRIMDLNELAGFQNALMKLCIPVKLHKPTIDVCGTGGDNKNTFNISTLSAFVLAASGVPVAKHGNFASTSISGSSDILKHFGYTFKTNEQELNDDLEKNNLCFIHAPLFHPAMKNVAPVRRGLKTNTLFNLMGPLVNPAQTEFKYVGVFNRSVARLYNFYLQTGTTKYYLVNSLDGYDEISLTSDVLITTNNNEQVIPMDELPFKTIKPEEISAGDSIEDAAKIFSSVLKDEALEAQKNVVIINSAYAMQCYNGKPIDECIAICAESIESKKAFQLFNQIIQN
ncbi:MAG: anthranilate phosphoribosyltransferase [Lentimicrobiaceae bacterium]|jgi:anthranilate phosphoribosyltransferase